MKAVKKIFLILLIVFLVVMVVGVIWFAWASRANKIELESDPVNYECQEEVAKKALVVYQTSRTDFANDVVDSYAENLSNNGYDVLVNHPGDYMPTDISEYDLVIFQSSVYMSQISPVMIDYIKGIEKYGDAKLLFVVTGMLDSTEEFTSIEDLFKEHKLTELFKVTQSNYKNNENFAWEKIKNSLK